MIPSHFSLAAAVHMQKDPVMQNMLWVRKAALLVLFLVTTAGLEAAVVNLNPTADALVTTGPANNLVANNYGGGGALGLSAAGLAKGEFQSVLRFDPGGAKATFDTLYGAGQWHLQSVTLQLSAGTNNNALYNANAAGSFGVGWLANDSWTEGTGTPGTPTQNGLTYNTLLGTYLNGLADETLGSFTYNGANSGTFTYSLNLTSGFSADLLGGNLTSLRLFAADPTVSYLFSSRSFGTAANWPVLSITAVPEPGMVGIFALAGIILLAGARKRLRP